MVVAPVLEVLAEMGWIVKVFDYVCVDGLGGALVGCVVVVLFLDDGGGGAEGEEG